MFNWIDNKFFKKINCATRCWCTLWLICTKPFLSLHFEFIVLSLITLSCFHFTNVILCITMKTINNFYSNKNTSFLRLLLSAVSFHCFISSSGVRFNAHPLSNNPWHCVLFVYDTVEFTYISYTAWHISKNKNNILFASSKTAKEKEK